MSKKSDEIRKSFKENDDIRDHGLKKPVSIERYDDIFYGEDKYWQRLDVYRPLGIDHNLPVIISVHGGGWVYGDKERYQYYCMDLAKRGFAVVNFTYRLAPEYKFPAHIEDTALVFHWVLNNADKYKMDIGNVFAVGDSAGAHTLSMYVNMRVNEAYREKVLSTFPMNFPDSYKDTSLKIKAIGLNCGKYLMDRREELIQEYKPLEYLDEFFEFMNLPPHIGEGFPPTFIMSCEDFLKDEPRFMIERFDKYHIPYEYHFYGDEKNKLPHVFHCDIKSKYAKICNDEQCEYFKGFI
ncbi:MAG: alpha/beta hydrolase [Lachnospiraceae bacterium]|nr:alpha/beta hydrolase [Lachnospiraceae bacterium]